jgi:hemerythrin-like domain-containing protein
MLPIGPLMIEHRLIERMIDVIAWHSDRATKSGSVDPSFIDAAVDFIRTYADRTHHGKEEDILFRDLAQRDMSDEDSRVMDELIQEHKMARGVVADVVAANESYRNGDESALGPILDRLRQLVEFYPRHIGKEDRVFFPASMEYLTAAEKDAMLEEMWTFDREMIHQKYRQVVDGYEEERNRNAGAV